MPDPIEAILSSLRALADEYFAALAYILPRSLAMILALVFGWLLGRLIGKLVATLVRFSKADEALKGTPLGEYLGKAGYTLSSLLDLVARATVYALSTAIAIKVLRIPEAEAVAHTMFVVIGRIVGGTLVLIAGLLIVEKIFDIVDRIFVDVNITTKILINVTHGFVMFLVVVAALSAAGVDLSPLADIIAALAQGIGFGAGAVLVLIAVALYWEDLSKILYSLRHGVTKTK